MFFIFKFALYFSISFVILSFPIGEKTVFEHVNKVAHPYTNDIYKSVKTNVNTGIEKGTKIGKDLFSNTSPTTDQIKTKYSSMKKKAKKIEAAIEKNHEAFTVEEKELLMKVLNKEGQL
jgi:hypothetical protein